MYEIFEKLMKEKGVTPYRVHKETGIATSTLSDWKNGKSTPKQDKLQKIADYFNVSLDYLAGNSKGKNTKTNEIELSKKAERDIQKSISQTLDMLENSQDGLMFDGEPLELDDLTKELLRQSLENSMRMAKKIAKEKYTPKKYRK
ncbi:helix-turn-helix domain-containing protein [Clostridium beijerinckii]|uniref:Transcriptional regulator with XRE-family HTH domain n=1 Tax=Clostridium beijerinckii TaxID=1520 RepID=A0AAE5LRD6_CLOBE|nr:helix-turn-helix transcriptional regulator [Clostridium beijerinckii]NSB15872.1 transcriptional regulator with XRE-family HTH domain [Clostridium beijerinckii]OOM27995.1 HTH-type transcriptional regulator Xre [Clostridium beijerinckii]